MSQNTFSCPNLYHFLLKLKKELPPIWIPIKWENILFSSNEVIRSNKNGEVAKSFNNIIQSPKQKDMKNLKDKLLKLLVLTGLAMMIVGPILYHYFK
jgi:hypothetical protein